MRKINVDFQGNQSKKIDIFKYVGTFAMHDGCMCNCNLTESKKATEQKKSFKNSSIMIL